MEATRKIIVTFRGDNPRRILLEPRPDAKVGYAESEEVPGLIKIWVDRKTYLIPISSVESIEMEL